jgi:UDP-N-acetylmuramoylalanine--D-glutamate ligase
MKIAIAGYGIEGQANYRYFAGQGHEVAIADERRDLNDLPVGVPTILGEGVFGQLSGFDMVIRTASLSPRKIVTDGKIWSATNEFFARCPAPIIGVTGTKGKGTTCSMITSLLRAAGKTVHLVGNIGVPALDVLPDIKADDIVVFEMSSFQLWDLEKSPHVSVVLMIEPDHLNVHDDFADYVSAKANIRRNQTLDDFCIYHPTNPVSRSIALGLPPNSSYEEANWQATAGRYAVPEDNQVYVKSNTFFVQEQPICAVSALQLPGLHNQENACAALSVALKFTHDYAALERGLREFEGLPHRLELVREFEGVKYYNDSFSSAPGATVAAIKSFSEPEILILGGIDKGADFKDLADTIRAQSNVKQIFIIGEIRHKLADYLASSGVVQSIDVLDVKTMPEIVDAARSRTDSGDVVILSPGCASFDMFKNFYDRGDQFRAVVEAL